MGSLVKSRAEQSTAARAARTHISQPGYLQDGRHHVRHHASGDGRAEGGIQAQDAHQVRVHLQVLSASLHQALQPHDPRALAQGRRHVHVRGVWQDLQAAGQPEAAQMWVEFWWVEFRRVAVRGDLSQQD